MKAIFVLHEFGCPSHYRALSFLAKQHNLKVYFCEFNIIEQLHKRPFNAKRFIHNILILLFLIISPPQKIILGIAPINHALSTILSLYKKHKIYYHTSYTFWDFKTIVHPAKKEKDVNIWKFFLEKKSKRIFAVSEKTKNELCAHFSISPNKITVVNHAYNKVIHPTPNVIKNNHYLSVGELSYRKGTEELLSFFSGHPEITLTLVGNGDLTKTVQEYSKIFKNIQYRGFISDWPTLEACYKSHSFLILNSHRTNQWEELFGMVLIEGMACGCVPLATAHSGPKEIIKSNYNGFLYNEGDVSKAIEVTRKLNNMDYSRIRNKAIACGQEYSEEKKCLSWSAILK